MTDREVSILSIISHSIDIYPVNLDGNAFLPMHWRDPSNYLFKNRSSKYWESIWLFSMVFSMVCPHTYLHFLFCLLRVSSQSSWLLCQTYLPTPTTKRRVSQVYTISRLVLGLRLRPNSMHDSWIVSIYTTRKRKVVLESLSLDCVSYYLISFPAVAILIIDSLTSQRQWSLQVLSFPLDWYFRDGLHNVTCLG